MPSPFESLSMVLLEAWNHGLPALVNARCKVLRGQVRARRRRSYYGNAVEFIAGLDYLLDHPDAARQLGRQGLAHVDRGVPLADRDEQDRGLCSARSITVPRRSSAALHYVRSRRSLPLPPARSCGDMETVFDVAHHRAQHLLPFTDALLRDQDVAAARHHAGPDHPDVEIVHVENAGHAFDRGNHRRHVHPRRRAFEQHGGALAEDAVAAVENERGNQQRHQRIAPARHAAVATSDLASDDAERPRAASPIMCR